MVLNERAKYFYTSSKLTKGQSTARSKRNRREGFSTGIRAAVVSNPIFMFIAPLEFTKSKPRRCSSRLQVGTPSHFMPREGFYFGVSCLSNTSKINYGHVTISNQCKMGYGRFKNCPLIVFIHFSFRRSAISSVKRITFPGQILHLFVWFDPPFAASKRMPKAIW